MPKKRIPGIIQAAEKRKEVLSLRRRGMSYEAIGGKLNLSALYCRNVVSEALKALAANCTDSAVEIRQLEEERLDKLYASYVAKAEAGCHKSAELCLKIMARRSALRGLDEPSKVDILGTWSAKTDQELLQEAKAMGLPVPKALQLAYEQHGPEGATDAEPTRAAVDVEQP